MKPWDFSRSAIQMGGELAEGLPGAWRIVMEVITSNDEDGAKRLFTLMATMDLRHYAIWYAFDICGQSSQSLVNRVAQLDTSLVDTVNERLEADGYSRRCVHDGAIEWPAQLPPPDEIRRGMALFS